MVKTINESFDDREYALLKNAKGKLSWRQFILGKIEEPKEDIEVIPSEELE